MRGHLIRRNGTYWFRRRIPKDLAAKVGKSEIRRSLETRCPREARLRSSHAWIATQGLFEAMRTPTLSEQQVQLIIGRLLDEPVHQSATAAELMDQARKGDWSFFDMLFSPSGDGYLESLSEPERQKLGDIMERMVAFEGQEVMRAERAVAEKKVEVSEFAALSQEREKLDWMQAAIRSRDLAQKLINRLHVEVAVNKRLQAQSPAPLPATAPISQISEPLDDRQPPQASKPKKPGKHPLFSELIERFIQEKTRAVEGGYTQQTVAQTRATFRLWLDLMGDKPVSEYTGKDAMAFRELLLRMPASHGKAVETGIRVKAMDAIHQADKREISEQITIARLSMKTTKRHFSSLSQYWKWLLPGDYVDRNIFGGFSFPGTKSKKAARDDWSDDQLKLFYSSKWIEAAPRDSAHRWLLTIALFSGLRLEEIARLRPQDIVNIDGTDAFYIHEHEDGWSPKTEAGERYVPIHPVLIDLGFLEIVSQRRATHAPRIWKDLSPSGPDQDFGVDYGRKFGKWRDKLGIPRKVVLHSSRHNVSTLLRNAPPDAVREVWIDAVLGHENGLGSVGASVYLKRIGIQNLKKAVDLINYADDVKAAIRAAMLG